MEALLYDDNDILERVDEYTLYCHYLGYEPELRISYSSPIRTGDNTPSFGVYIPRSQKGNKRVEYMWSDRGAGGKFFGDVFDLVRYIYGYRTREQAIFHVKKEFFLGGITEQELNLMTRPAPPPPPPMRIRVKSRAFTMDELAWWRAINITSVRLNRFRTTPVKYYWMIEGQDGPQFPGTTMYAYNIYDRYQLYRPFEDKRHKFRNDLQEDYVMGLPQLRGTSDTLIITKSYKDVMCLDSFNFESITPRSEGTMLPEKIIEDIRRHYKHIFLLFDNDGKHNAELYPQEFHRIFVPEQSLTKDTTDFCRKNGPNETLFMLNSIMYGRATV